jgi:hypothetical protein
LIKEELTFAQQADTIACCGCWMNPCTGLVSFVSLARTILTNKVAKTHVKHQQEYPPKGSPDLKSRSKISKNVSVAQGEQISAHAIIFFSLSRLNRYWSSFVHERD